MPPKQILIKQDIQSCAKDLIKSLKIGRTFLVVSDENTHKILGKNILQSLGCGELTFDNNVSDNISFVEIIQQKSKEFDAIIAVGSGTINDLCKYASFLNNMPYVIFGTAPSMNGYASGNASITIDGYKTTVKAHQPTAIYLDLDILCEAPIRLIKSGLGDSICRSVAQADWLLSHLLLNTKYDERPFELLKSSEKDLFSNSHLLLKKDMKTMNMLAENLICSGMGMNICGGSYPASQAEHMMAHTMHMKYGVALPKNFHGEEIAVTTITMAKFQEDILNNPQPPEILVPQNKDVKSKIFNYFADEKVANECYKSYQKKVLTGKQLDKINHFIKNNWLETRQKIMSEFIESSDLISILEKAKIGYEPEHIGWNVEDYTSSVNMSKYTRDRFTFLDILAKT